jgi:hypothetical protein
MSEEKKEIPTPNKLTIISNNLNRQSTILIVCGILITAFGLFLSWKIYNILVSLTNVGADRIGEILKANATVDKDHKIDTTTLLIFLIFRTTAIGTIGGFIIFFFFKLAKSCFDQATRFIKRRHGAQFLEHISQKETDLDKEMRAFFIWNLNVESAFSDKHENDANKFSIGNVLGFETNKDGTTTKSETTTGSK